MRNFGTVLLMCTLATSAWAEWVRLGTSGASAYYLDVATLQTVNGYRQAWEHLDGQYDFTTMRDKGIAATRQLAKRQITWLRSMPARQAIACDAPDALQRVVEAAGAAWCARGKAPRA